MSALNTMLGTVKQTTYLRTTKLFTLLATINDLNSNYSHRIEECLGVVRSIVEWCCGFKDQVEQNFEFLTTGIKSAQLNIKGNLSKSVENRLLFQMAAYIMNSQIVN